MALSEGSWLNHYEILSHLGTGGMGEVYRARDNKLQREVALKVLPKAFAQDPERLGRFRREAQVLAQVNHPNIAAIYSVEESGETHFLVMELAQGETLRDRIKRGPVSIEEALEIAKQIAAGLEAAHEKPIVHRDLKPANVKVTPEGVVKILDFGLARAFSGDPGTGDPSDSPTLSAMTAPGTILGTAAYMSPEQARGKKVDKRTDIWAFGCVLYEMLTGKHAFDGEDVTDILASVVKSEPDWQALPENTPRGIRILLRRCLQKDKDRRLRDAGDARVEIEEAATDSEISVPAPAPATTPTPPFWRRALVPGLMLAVGLVIASIAVWKLKPTPAQPVTRFAITLPENEQLGGQGRGLVEPVVAISPDGEHLAYVTNQQLYLRAMGQFESSAIPGTEGAHEPFFSPDGQWLAFFSDGKLKKVSVSGGAPLTLCDAPVPRGGSWVSDDTIVFAPSRDGLWQVSAAGGTPQQLTSLDGANDDTVHAYPQRLPGGKAVLFRVVVGLLVGDRIEVLSLETGERKVLIEGATDVRYVPTGHLVYAQRETPGTLLAVPFDPGRLEVTGAPVPVLEGVMQLGGPNLAQFSFSNSGSLVYVPGGTGVGDRTLVWVDRQGVVEPLGAPARRYNDPRLSPDGQRLAVRVVEDSSDVWVYAISRNTLTRLTFEGSLNILPLWTPDGNRVAFQSNREGSTDIFWKPADGSSVAERLTTSEQVRKSPSSWSPDGRFLAFYERPANEPAFTANWDIWVLPLEGERKPMPFLQTPFREGGPAFSPDGRWIAYASNESGRREIYVQPYPGPGGKWQISTEGGREAVWARNGRELFYRSGNRMMAVDITTEPSFRAGTPRMLFEGNFVPTGQFRANYDISPDGQRFVMVQPSGGDSGGSQINVVLNWFEELKQRVPTGGNR